MPAAECSIVPGITSYYTVHCTVQVKGTGTVGRKSMAGINQSKQREQRKERKELYCIIQYAQDDQPQTRRKTRLFLHEECFVDTTYYCIA